MKQHYDLCDMCYANVSEFRFGKFMRWVLRSLLFWVISLPVFYLFGLPYLLTKLSDRARLESFVQCQTHLKEERIAYVPTALMKVDRADQYCHCVSDPITLTRADLFELARKKQAERLNNAMKPVIEACNSALQDDMSKAISAGAPTHSTFDENGVETVHFN